MISLSLYIHIPFCIKKCRYCDFYSVPYDSERVRSYLDSFEREIDLLAREGLLDGTIVRSVYIGGGTPSVLSAPQLWSLCRLVRNRFSRVENLEWSVECNPESFSQEKASALLDGGVNRLSFGMQSLNERELAVLGRAHGPARCRELLAEPALERFASVGVDLMYGLPGQTVESLEATVREVLESPYIKHISAYELTIAEGTPFGRHRTRLPRPGHDEIGAMTECLWALLAENGFEHYEISNFAKRGHHSRHNEAYWDHSPYLGLGCAANSYRHPCRWANVKDVSRYCSMIADEHLPREFTEELDSTKLAEEMLFLGLRRAAGIDEEAFREKCGFLLGEFADNEKIAEFVRQGLLMEQKPFLMPTERGMLFADAMARELMK